MTLGWPELTALDAYRITEIPRRPGPGETGASSGLPNDPGRTQRLAALIAAYHAGAGDSGALALGWVRHRAGGPVQFLAAGPGLIGSQDDREVLLTLPGGARAEPLARGALATLMARAAQLAGHRRAPAGGRATHRAAAPAVAGGVPAGGVARGVRLAAGGRARAER